MEMVSSDASRGQAGSMSEATQLRDIREGWGVWPASEHILSKGVVCFSPADYHLVRKFDPTMPHLFKKSQKSKFRGARDVFQLFKARS